MGYYSIRVNDLNPFSFYLWISSGIGAGRVSFLEPSCTLSSSSCFLLAGTGEGQGGNNPRRGSHRQGGGGGEVDDEEEAGPVGSRPSTGARASVIRCRCWWGAS